MCLLVGSINTAAGVLQANYSCLRAQTHLIRSFSNSCTLFARSKTRAMAACSASLMPVGASKFALEDQPVLSLQSDW